MQSIANRRGFTLIEVLVTLVILMFGMLGIVGLMARGQKASYEAYQRQMALSLASDMMERILSNKSQAALNFYVAAAAPPANSVGAGARYNNLLSGTLTPNCGTLAAPAVCSDTQLAAYDLALWEGLLQGYGERSAGAARIGGVINARGCIEQVAAPAACPPATPNPPWVNTTYRVSVAWQGNENLGNVTNPSTCGTGLYGAAGQRRVVSLDFLVFQACPGT